VLGIDRCEIELAGARGLARATFVGTLRRLNADHNSFGPEGLRALLKKKPRELHTLCLMNNDLGDEGVSALAKSPASDSLLELNLGQNGLGDPGAKALANSKHLGNLLILRVNTNPMSKEAAEALGESPLGQRLAVLDRSNLPHEDIPF
jgi:hypothetical protein